MECVGVGGDGGEGVDAAFVLGDGVVAAWGEGDESGGEIYREGAGVAEGDLVIDVWAVAAGR